MIIASKKVTYRTARVAMNTAAPHIRRLTEAGNYFEAFALADNVRRLFRIAYGNDRRLWGYDTAYPAYRDDLNRCNRLCRLLEKYANA